MSFTRFFRRRHWDAERSRELQSYLDIETDENIARGMRPDDARAEAHRKLGNATLVREEIYRMNSLTFLESLWQDLRHGARLLRLSPGFTLVALVSLSLGIGANAAFFQLLDAVRLRSLPIRNAHELVEIRVAASGVGRTGRFVGSRPALSNPLWERIREHQRTLTDTFAYGTVTFDLSTGGESRTVEGLWVSGGYFSALEARPVVGRLIEPADDVRGCATRGAVISYPFWQREFGGAPDVGGRSLRLDGQPFVVQGVAPRGFAGVEVGRAFDVAVPICAQPLIRPDQPGLDRGDFWWLAAFGRRPAGASIEQVSAELGSISPGIFAATAPSNYTAEDAASYQAFRLEAFDAATGVSSLRTRYGTSLTLLLSIAGLVLLIACANLANLMFARASVRAKEIAIRLAIGASRARVVRQLLCESLLLAGIGAAAGVWVALSISRVLMSLLTSDGSPWMLDLALNWRLVGFTIVVAAITCLIFGVVPAARATRTSPSAVMKAGGRGLTASPERFALRRTLVVGQLAISLVLVVGALLFISTLRNLATLDPGFTSDRVLVVSADLRAAGVATERQVDYQQDLLTRLSALPGVEHAAAVAIVPAAGSVWNQRLVIDGTKQEGYPDANRVSPAYFAALDIAFREGRTFDERDAGNARPVAIVNEAFAAKYLPGGRPIGRTFKLDVGPGEPDLAYEVVGVVEDTAYSSLRTPMGPIMYFPALQETAPGPFATFLLRTAGDPDDLRPTVVRAVAEAHSSILLTFDTLARQIRNSLLRERLMASLSAGLAGLAVLLAAVGLFGLLSYTVASRRSEIGVRVALGATRAGIVGMVLGETAVLVAVGMILGAGLSVASGRAAAELLFGVAPSSPVVIGGAAGLLALVAGVAGALPALRASRLNPIQALREEN